MINRSGFFKWNAPSGSDSVLQPWYDGLSVKPSAGLWSDLKTMADGMASDGDWLLIDFFGLWAAMETEEQQLKPLISTSGNLCSKSGAPTLNSNGLTTSSGNFLDLNWDASLNGVNYQRNNAMLMNCNSSVGAESTGAYFGKPGTLMFKLNVGGTNYGVLLNSSSNQTFTASAIGHKALFRTDSANVSFFDNGIITQKTQASSALSAGTIRMGSSGGGVYPSTATNRYMIAASGTASASNIRSRLNTFFAARGLATY